MLIFILIILLSNPQICLEASLQGINMWLNVIIPTLLPFIIISNIILNVYSKHMKNPSIYVIFIGLCCGCPMAAILATNLYQKKQLSKNQCECLIGTVNCLSPAFLINFCFMKTLGFAHVPIKLLFATYLPVFIMLVFYKIKVDTKDFLNIEESTQTRTNDLVTILENSILNAFLAMIKLGGYILLCNIFAAFSKILLCNNELLACIFSGFIEVTTGINAVGMLSLPMNLKILLCGVLYSFGGICCILQTAGIMHSADLSIKKYIYHKIQISLLTLLLYYLVIYVL